MSNRARITRLRRKLQEAQDELLTALTSNQHGNKYEHLVAGGGPLVPFNWDAYNRDQRERAIERGARGSSCNSLSKQVTEH